MMKKRILAFAMSICFLFMAFETVVFAEERTNMTLIPGLWQSFMIRDDNSLWGWGANGSIEGYAFIGDGTTIPRFVPVKIMDDVKTVASGYECTFIIKNDNSLWGFGSRLPGLLNQGEDEFQLSPIKIMDDVAKIAVNDGMESSEIGALILKTDGSLWESGWNGAIIQNEPKQIMTDVQDVFARLNHFQAITNDGSLLVWGDAYDRLGKVPEQDKSVPMKIMDDAEHCTVELHITYVVKKDGSIWGYGYNWLGRLGETNLYSISPENMELITTPVKIADGALPQIGEWLGRLYYMKKDNSLWVISDDFLYDSITGQTAYFNAFDKVMDNVDYFNTDMADHIFIIQKDGTFWANTMLSNTFAQLGDGTADQKFNPIALANASGIKEAHDIVARAMLDLQDNKNLSRLDMDNFLRYAEESILVSTRTSVKAANINKTLIEEQNSRSDELKSTLNYRMSLLELQYYRELKEGVSIVITDGSAINIEPSVLEADVDNINVIGNGFGVVIEAESLKNELSEGKTLQIAVEPIAANKYKVEINRDALSQPIKVQVPVRNSMVPARLCVVDAEGNAVPSLFNSANGKLEFKPTSGGIYTVQENLTSFTDIEDSDLGIQLAVNYLALKGIIPGTRTAAFSPDEPITRAEVVTLITKALGVYDADAKSKFVDVAENHPYFSGVGSAEKIGIISGMATDHFEPDSVIQKAQFAAICVNALNFRFDYESLENPEEYLASFSDMAAIPEWSQKYVATAIRDGIFGIAVEDSFNPGQALTRGEFARIFNRLYKLSW